MPVKLNSTGGGSVTLTTPSTASDFTATFPANTGNVVTDSATQTLTNKTLTSPTITTPVIATINGGSGSSITLQSNGTNGLIIDTSQNLQFNSGYGSVATAYGCRAWVNFNGTGVVAIRASGNVTSITDNGTGDYTVNFTNALPDANFAATFGASPQNGRWLANWNGVYNNGTTAITNTTTTLRIAMIDNTGTLADPTNVYVAVFR